MTDASHSAPESGRSHGEHDQLRNDRARDRTARDEDEYDRGGRSYNAKSERCPAWPVFRGRLAALRRELLLWREVRHRDPPGMYVRFQRHSVADRYRKKRGETVKEVRSRKAVSPRSSRLQHAELVEHSMGYRFAGRVPSREPYGVVRRSATPGIHPTAIRRDTPP